MNFKLFRHLISIEEFEKYNINHRYSHLITIRVILNENIIDVPVSAIRPKDLRFEVNRMPDLVRIQSELTAKNKDYYK